MLMIYCLVFSVPGPSQDLLLPSGIDQTYLGVNSQLNERQEFLQEHPSWELSDQKGKTESRARWLLPFPTPEISWVFMFILIAVERINGSKRQKSVGRGAWDGIEQNRFSGKMQSWDWSGGSEVWISTCRIILPLPLYFLGGSNGKWDGKISWGGWQYEMGCKTWKGEGVDFKSQKADGSKLEAEQKWFPGFASLL